MVTSNDSSSVSLDRTGCIAGALVAIMVEIGTSGLSANVATVCFWFVPYFCTIRFHLF